MRITKSEFVFDQLRKTKNKSYENYVISRIYYLLNDSSLKFVTQQYVKRPGGYALLDMFFPQLNFYIEVDETGHKKRFKSDEIRFGDIVHTTGLTQRRIKVYNRSIEEINKDIASTVRDIRKLKNTLIKQGIWEEWKIKNEMNPDYYVRLGYLDIRDNPAFKTQNDVFRCFGLIYNKPQFRCYKKHPEIENNFIWCPKFFYNSEWRNESVKNNSVIKVYRRNYKKNFKKQLEKNPHEGSRMVFGHIISPFGGKYYKFLGQYEFDRRMSLKNNAWTYKRINTRISTFRPSRKKVTR